MCVSAGTTLGSSSWPCTQGHCLACHDCRLRAAHRGARGLFPAPSFLLSSLLLKSQACNVFFPVFLEGFALPAWRHLRSPALLLLLLDPFGLFQSSCLASSKENQSLPGMLHHQQGSSPAVQLKLFLALAELENRLRAPELQRWLGRGG